MISSISSYSANRVNFRANPQKAVKTATDLGSKVVNKTPKGLTSNTPLRLDGHCPNGRGTPECENPISALTMATTGIAAVFSL